MKVIFYSTDAELRQILQTRVDPAAPAVMLLPASLTRCLGLTEHQEQRAIAWAAPAGAMEKSGSSLGKAD